MLDSLDTLIAFVLIMLVVSLLITIAVQMASAALNLRGVNLAQGLKMTFGVIDPKSDDHAKELANYILKGRYLSDSFLPGWPILRWWRHAEAVRPREVFDAIQRIALGKESGDYGYVSTWAKIKAWLTKTEVPNLSEKARRILQGLGIPEDKIATATTAIASGQQVAKEFTDAAEASYERFDYWTCTCQERAQQWLTMHARILTIIFAAVAAIGLQLDTVEIFKTVSSNKAVRDKLVAQAATVSSQAEKTLGDSPSVLQKAYQSWLPDTDDKVKVALNSSPVNVTATDTRESVIRQIDKVLTTAVADKRVDKNSLDAALKSFVVAVDSAVKDSFNASGDQYAKVKADLDDTGFLLFPNDSRFWLGSRWKDGWKSVHVVGVLFSIGLLSLGAPFWYNALKNLVSLRSTVAQNISTEQKEAKKQPDKPKATPPPMPTGTSQAKPAQSVAGSEAAETGGPRSQQGSKRL